MGWSRNPSTIAEVKKRAEITVPFDQLELVEQVRGGDFALRADMPVQIMIPLRKRTALQYALEPLTQSLWRSFGKQ